MKIEAELGHNMERNKAFTLGHLLGLHITEVKEHIIAVSTEATNEAGLEALLRKVQDKWVHTEFVVNPYKDMKVRHGMSGRATIVRDGQACPWSGWVLASICFGVMTASVF